MSSLRENTLNYRKKKLKLTAYFRSNPGALLSYEVIFSISFPGLLHDYAEISALLLRSFSVIARNDEALKFTANFS